MTDYVVTGGAGAIGSRLVARLLMDEADARVVVVDDLSSGFRWLLPDGVELTRLDVDDLDEEEHYRRLLDRPIVFHLAALFANQNSVEHPDEDLMTNGLGTMRALGWAAAMSARAFVYAGAGCSIGSERTPYQITKALGESYCRYFREQRGLPVSICRLRNSYGPGEVPGKYRNAIPNFIWAALRNEPITVYGTGEETRDWVYVEDVVDALVRAAHVGEDWDVGTGVQTSVIDVVDMVLGLTGSKSQVIRGKARPWEHQHEPIHTSVRAETQLVKGLPATIAWFSDNMGKIEESVQW